MYGADRHMDYHRERQVDHVSAASRRELAREVAVARDADRRSFLQRTWQRRFRPAGVPVPAHSTSA